MYLLTDDSRTKASSSRTRSSDAKILYEDTSLERPTNLGEIEEAVRKQMQKHVMPEVGVFLSKRLQGQAQDTNDGSKASLESYQ